MKKALIIEDDKDLNRGITFTFEKEGFEVYSAMTLSQAREFIKMKVLEFIILDLNLPDGDGLSLCKEIRVTSEVPIIMLTARDLEIDEVIGLESGADDYITKPFSLSVLKARVAAVLRRRGKENTKELLQSNGIILDIKTMKVKKHGEEIECSVTEFKLLRYLMENKNQVLLKEQILSTIWDKDSKFVDENTLPVNIRRLRQKLENNSSNPEFIKTVHGMGYIWSVQNEV